MDTINYSYFHSSSITKTFEGCKTINKVYVIEREKDHILMRDDKHARFAEDVIIDRGSEIQNLRLNLKHYIEN